MTHYKVDESNTIRCWESEEASLTTSPFLLQPHYPNGDAFETQEDAIFWAEQFVAFHTDTTNTVPHPPDKKDGELIVPPSKEEISKMEFQANLNRFGWDPEMIREVLNGN